jgi:hypothetical protein
MNFHTSLMPLFSHLPYHPSYFFYAMQIDGIDNNCTGYTFSLSDIVAQASKIFSLS